MDRARRRTVRAAPGERAREQQRGPHRTQGGTSLMSEPEVRQTPPGPPPEAGSSPSPPAAPRPGAPSPSPRSATPDRPAPRPPPAPQQRRSAPAAPAAPGRPGRRHASGRGRPRAEEPESQRGRGRAEERTRRVAAGPSDRAAGAGRVARPPFQAGRPLPGLRARAAADDPDRHARRPLARRALRVAGRRRHQPDRRQRLPGPGAERAAGHGGGLRRHRDPEERRAVPGRRALRQGRHRGWDLVAAPH